MKDLVPIHRVDVELFHSIRENFDLMVTLDEESKSEIILWEQ